MVVVQQDPALYNFCKIQPPPVISILWFVHYMFNYNVPLLLKNSTQYIYNLRHQQYCLRGYGVKKMIGNLYWISINTGLKFILLCNWLMSHLEHRFVTGFGFLLGYMCYICVHTQSNEKLRKAIIWHKTEFAQWYTKLYVIVHNFITWIPTSQNY